MSDDALYTLLEERKREQAAAKGKHISGVKGKRKGMSEEERREIVRRGLLKKKESERKALDIVERLTENNIEKEWLRDAFAFLTPEYYHDVTEERSIGHDCGFPLCDTPLVSVPKKQFHISLKDNKVYDITERKNFCSNACFKQSSFVKGQISSEPLWMREKGKVKRVLFLEEAKKKKALAVPDKGMVVDMMIAAAPKDSDCDIPSSDENKENGESRDSHEDTPMDVQDSPPPPSFRPARVPIKPKPRKQKPWQPEVPINDRVEKSLAVWYTIDSFRYLYGDDHVRVCLRENGCTLERIVSTLGDTGVGVAAASRDASFKEAYIKLCRKLDLVELTDEQGDKDERKPVPSFETLQKESEGEHKRVGSFFAGKTDYVMERDVESMPMIGDDGEPMQEPRVPLSDQHAKMALRRRVMHDQLDRTLPDLLAICHLLPSDVCESFRKLILTFSLDAENIAVNINEWTLIAIYMLVILSKCNPALEGALKNADVRKKLNMVLLSYNSNLDSMLVYSKSLHANIHQLLTKIQKDMNEM